MVAAENGDQTRVVIRGRNVFELSFWVTAEQVGVGKEGRRLHKERFSSRGTSKANVVDIELTFTTFTSKANEGGKGGGACTKESM